MEGIHFTPEGRGSGRGEFRSLAEVASLLGVTVDELTFLPYGEKQQMVMVEAVQLDDDAPVNTNATRVLKKLANIPVTIRGHVVCFPEGLPEEPVGA